jgi:hypothetical protein
MDDVSELMFTTTEEMIAWNGRLVLDKWSSMK